MRKRQTKVNKARRALTIYFATATEKKAFDVLAEGFGLSSSTLGTMLIYSGMKNGFKITSDGLEISGVPTKSRKGVESRRRPSGKSPHSRKKTKLQSERRPSKAP